MRSRRSWPRYQVDPPGRRIIASKSPASGRGIALAVLHHDADQPTLAFFPAARSGAQYFQEFFGDDGAIGVNARSKAGHRLLVGVEVEDPRRAWFLAGAFPKSGELGRDQTAVEICPMTVPLGIRDGLIISPARTETSGECEGNNCQSGQSGGQYIFHWSQSSPSCNRRSAQISPISSRFRRLRLRPARLRGERSRSRWWALKDLNLRPTDYESAALTN